jgi:simple sugar transport system permease protein
MSKSTLVRFRKFLVTRPEGGVLVAVLAMYVGFSLGSEHFMAIRSTISMLTLSAEWGIAALGVALLMIGGEFDLSVGSVWGLSSLIATLMVTAGVASPIAVVIVLIGAVVIGLVQGLAVVKLGIPSFIITLGSMMSLRGIIYVTTSGSYVQVPRGDAFFQIFSFRFENRFNVTALWFLGVAIIVFLILHRTRFGNWIFATGGNKLAAIQAGVPVDRVKLILFGLSSGLASLAGIIQMTRFPVTEAQRGQLVEMFLIAMVVMGGTRLSGGYGSVVGVVLGVFLMAIIQNGLSLMGVPGYWYQGIVGIVILFAVTVNINSQKRAMGVRNE